MKAIHFLIGCVWISQVTAGEFANLDFESCNEGAVVGQIGPDGYLVGSGPVKDLLPGWKLTLHSDLPPPSSDEDVQIIGFNELTSFCFGAPCYSIDSREAFSDAAPYLLGQMTGNNAFVFDIGAIPSGYSLTLSQRGEVPLGATAVDLDVILPGARTEVRLDGTLVYERYTLEPPSIQDISAFVGKTVDLEIRFVQAVSLGRSGGGLDRVRFVMGPADTGLKIAKIPEEGGHPENTTLHFTAVIGRDYFVEFRDSLGPESSWQTLPGAPHNSGSVTDFTTDPQRFYRVRSVVSGS